MNIKNYSEKQLSFMAEEWKMPISKVIMILDNPPENSFKPCKDCKEKEKEE